LCFSYFTGIMTFMRISQLSAVALGSIGWFQMGFVLLKKYDGTQNCKFVLMLTIIAGKKCTICQCLKIICKTWAKKEKERDDDDDDNATNDGGDDKFTYENSTNRWKDSCRF